MDLASILYHTQAGRLLLPVLTSRRLSEAVGRFLDTPASGFLIPFFVKKNGIDLSEYHTDQMCSFNDCFSRRIREELRPVDLRPQVLISPCDGLLKAFRIRDGLVINVKEARYSIRSLLKNPRLAARYEGGTCLVFRLCVQHYHRYCYIESGKKSRNVYIPGILHTVRPTALENHPVFTQNCRSYTLIRTERFRTILQMEVGAMLVGRIINHHEEAQVTRGEEKGCFQYGGSTIIVLLQPGTPPVAARYYEAALKGEEIPVRLGQALTEE